MAQQTAEQLFSEGFRRFFESSGCTVKSSAPERFVVDVNLDAAGRPVRFRYVVTTIRGLCCIEGDLGITVSQCPGCLELLDGVVADMHGDEHVCYGRFQVSAGRVYYRLHQFFPTANQPGLALLTSTHFYAQLWTAAMSDCVRFFEKASDSQKAPCGTHGKVVPFKKK